LENYFIRKWFNTPDTSLFNFFIWLQLQPDKKTQKGLEREGVRGREEPFLKRFSLPRISLL
jgi:hypothetical protein